MEHSEAVTIENRRQSGSYPTTWTNGSYRPRYRRGSNLSDVSFVSDVEMAQDEVFSGPIPESVPTSNASFAHQRARAGSTASFTYLNEREDPDEWTDGDVVVDIDEDDDILVRSRSHLESDPFSLAGRRPSAFSAESEQPLLMRRTSTTTNTSHHERTGRITQKMYIVTEDLTIVVAGFRTNALGMAVYVLLCTCTAGLAYLLFRWLPRWRVALVASPSPLRECQWVVIENQWGEFTTHAVRQRRYGRALSTIFGASDKRDGREDEEDDDPVVPLLLSLDYRYIRFCFHPLRDRFVLSNSWKDPEWSDVHVIRAGLDGEEKERRQLVFGKNLIEVEEKSIFQLLVDEAFHPFYVFQLASLFLWSIDEYYYYAICIFFISVVSITTTLIETKTTMARLREVSTFECDVRVLRNGFWRYVASGELVPGDVYEISDPSLTQFPCDSLLLSGDCIVNESMLTGESVPVSKIPATEETLLLLDLAASSIRPDLARHFLFCGTKIVRARRPHDDNDDEAVALAMVLRTGFNTTKGALVRSMLFPKPSGFKFYRDSFRYISVMGAIAAVAFVASFVNFVRLQLPAYLILIRALDLITIVVPPALPATLTIGTNFALRRLKQKQIFCISPQRVNVGGKLDVICLDKTGTLTEDGLDVLGIRVVEKPSDRFSDIVSDASSLLPGTLYERDPTVHYDLRKAVLYTMATCHSLRIVEQQLVGDPLDLKMFAFTGWSFEEGEQGNGTAPDDEQSGLSPSVARPPPGMEYDIYHAPESGQHAPVELGILRSFEFVTQLRRASVVVRQFGAAGGDIYVKGAPECMKEICRGETLPPDFDELLAYYTHRGFRVIACATKQIPKLSWVKVQKMKRAEVESELEFVGFIIFENKLKPITTSIIDELSDAGLRTIMCTGDNILTAISVARECNLIDRSAHCFVPHFAEGDTRTPKSRLVWESVDNPLFQLDDQTLMPLPPPAEIDASSPYDVSNIRNYSTAISGDVFRWMVDFAPQEMLHRMLASGQVYARMSPDEKHELVEKLQSIDYCCGFCGDGANDCGALKAADVGISLSEAEASVAAPFTSRVFDISCVPEVIREGRAALVTSFSCFKYMSLYSAIQFTSVSFLYASASNLGDFQFLFIDIFLVLPTAIFMGWTGPYPVLCQKRPTANLVSRKVLTPLLGQIALCILVQLAAYEAVRRQSWYIPPKLHRKKPDILNSENSALFLVSCYQYILSGIVLSIGPPFRQSMAENVPFVVTIVVGLLLSTYLLFDPAQWLQNFMQLTEMSMRFRTVLLLLALAGFACSWAGERTYFPRLAKWIGQATQWLYPKYRRKRKLYKLLQEEMRL
ncbi:MAG: hypothetical protein M1838_005256 [Thelocarpon superellum]|nr:MAG: hypothetical protein M1838_005256 [Thelocarpon superellum]